MSVVREFERAFNRQDVEALVACFTLDGSYHDTFFGGHAGPAALRAMFERMFRGRKPVVPNWKRRAENLAKDVRGTTKSESLEQSVVDLIRAEAGDLKRKLGAADQRRLDEYLQAVRSVENRIERSAR